MRVRLVLAAVFAAAVLFAVPSAALAVAPDAYEDDDTTATANVYVLGTAEARSLDTSSDIDWVRFSVTAGERYIIGTYGSVTTTDEADTKLYLYDSSGTLLISEDDDGPGYYSGFTYTATASGTWYLAIDLYGGGSNTGTYTFVADLVSTVSGTVRDAAGAPVPGAIVAVFSPYTATTTFDDDNDFQMDETAADGSYTIECWPGQHRLGAWSGSDIGYYDGAALLADATEFPVPGDAALTGYDITLSGLTGADAYESDGTTATATALTVPTAGQWRSIYPTGDVDIASFAVSPGHTYAVGTYGDDAFTDDADTYLYLVDSNGTRVIDTDDDGGPGYYSLVSATATQTETWYVRVRGYSSITDGAYRLAVSEVATISGTVRDGAGDPIEGCSVCAYGPWDCCSWGSVVYTTTAANGTYSLGGLVAAPYEVRFYGPTGYEEEWYLDAATEASATQITLGSGESRGSVDATLALSDGAEIRGTVTDRLGNGLSGLKVHASSDATDAWDWTYIGGTYTIDGLPGGDYTVWFEDTANVYLDEYYDDARDEDDAEVVHVEDGGIAVSIDATLTRAGGVSGSIVNSQSVDVAGAWAYLYQVSSSGSSYSLVDQDLTDASGDFAIGDLDAGVYTLRFTDPGGTYASEWWQDAALFDTCTTFTVSAGSTRTVGTAVIGRKSTIGGTFFNAGAQPLPGITATLYQKAGDEFFEVDTDVANGAGNYLFTALPAGDYYLGYEPTSTVYVAGYCLGSPSLAGADALKLTEWNNYWVNPMVMRPSAIEGTVTLGANPYAIVTAYLEDAGEISYAGVATATVPDGHYRIGGLAAGNYLLRFVAEGGDQEWYNATSTVAAATRIVLAPETTQSGYGADFSGPTVFGSIRGAVTDEQGGVAAPGIAVSAYAQDGSGWDLVETTLTAPTGLFNLTGLPSGVYRVGCEDPSGRLLPEFYDGAYSVAGGDDVTVTAPAATTGIDVSLDRASAVRGQVRNRLGVPVGPMNVYAYRQYGSAWVTAGTAASNPSTGLYTIGGLLPGTYSIRFAGDGVYRGEFYNDRHGDISTAQTFTVSLATTVSAIDAVVEPRNTLAPVTTSDAPSGWRSRTASVSLTATDNQAVYATWYSTGGAMTTYTPGAKIGITAEGTTTLLFRSADIVGNFESTRTATVLIDTVAPVTTDDAADEYDAADKVIVHLTPSDATSGIRRTLYAVDGAAASMGTVVEVEGVGPHTVQYRSQDAAGNWEATKTAAFTIHAAQVSVAGADRFGTCVLASQRGFADGADTVVVATGRNWPDALGGSALAGAYGGPILLVEKTDVPASIEDEIARLGASRAIIVGGTGAVDTAVATELTGLLAGAVEVTRVAGANRYDTARLVAARTVERLEATGGWGGAIFVATGGNYPDALGASPAAAREGMPIVLSQPGSGLDAATLATLDDLGVAEYHILGGTGAVPDSVKTQLNGIGAAFVQRFAGADRYDTAAQVAAASVDDFGMSWDGVAIATGTNYADALAGGPVQGAAGSVMLLTTGTSLNADASDALEANRDAIAEYVFLGGTGAVSQAVRDAVADVLW